jgi:hypothetical protein
MIRAGRGGRIINVTSVHEHVPRLGSRTATTRQGRTGATSNPASPARGRQCCPPS